MLRCPRPHISLLDRDMPGEFLGNDDQEKNIDRTFIKKDNATVEYYRGLRGELKLSRRGMLLRASISPLRNQTEKVLKGNPPLLEVEARRKFRTSRGGKGQMTEQKETV